MIFSSIWTGLIFAIMIILPNSDYEPRFSFFILFFLIIIGEYFTDRYLKTKIKFIYPLSKAAIVWLSYLLILFYFFPKQMQIPDDLLVFSIMGLLPATGQFGLIKYGPKKD